MSDSSKGTKDELIRIILRPIAHGCKSIFLQSLNAGERRTESLHLYLRPEESEEDKRLNEITMATARSIRDERLNQYRMADSTGPALIKQERPATLFERIELEIRRCQKENHPAATEHYQHLLSIMKRYTDDIPISHISRPWANSFYKWLCRTPSSKTDKPLSKNSIRTIVAQLSAVFAKAVEEGIVEANVMAFVKREKDDISHNEGSTYLNLQQLQALTAVPYKDNNIRVMFLFATYTGFSLSELWSLEWRNVIERDDLTFVEMEAGKKKQLVSIPLNEEARLLLPQKPRGKNGGSKKVFGKKITKPGVLYHLSKWAKQAGIDRFSFAASKKTFTALEILGEGSADLARQQMGKTSLHDILHYDKVLKKKAKDAVETLNKLFVHQINQPIEWGTARVPIRSKNQ